LVSTGDQSQFLQKTRNYLKFMVVCFSDLCTRELAKAVMFC
jgi:hypothetical protein